jgi:HK97 gp10 family phage protein
MSEIVKVTGLRELNTALTRLADDVARKHVRGAVAAGARIIRDAAVRNVPVRTGKLRRAIYSKWIAAASGRDRQTFLVSVRRGKNFQSKKRQNKRGRTVTTRDNDAYYWTWIEFGHVATGPTRIGGGSVRRARARSALKSAGRFVPPRPFLRPAFEANKTAAIEAVRAELAKRIVEGLRK